MSTQSHIDAAVDATSRWERLFCRPILLQRDHPASQAPELANGCCPNLAACGAELSSRPDALWCGGSVALQGKEQGFLAPRYVQEGCLGIPRSWEHEHESFSANLSTDPSSAHRAQLSGCTGTTSASGTTLKGMFIWSREPEKLRMAPECLQFVHLLEHEKHF
jgi:hypothetical protein